MAVPPDDYALPTRTLVQGVYGTIAKILNNLHLSDEIVKIQTCEQPDDPFFTLGSIVVTTYDQVLSGTLGGPYGLSNRLRNINAASTIGSIVVFDEFHLMPADKAFLTGVAICQLFNGFFILQFAFFILHSFRCLRVLRVSVVGQFPGHASRNRQRVGPFDDHGEDFARQSPLSVEHHDPVARCAADHLRGLAAQAPFRG